jgi:anti-sigma regulatory factor (Ser/Thr protein kinase)
VNTLELTAEPQSVRQARAWVIGELESLGRQDLIDAAELGVSELVTNAILHADPPILVRVGGTLAHPRVEVHDTSNIPPRVRDMTDEDRLLATIGRGLGIVAMYSTMWGAEISDQGKMVWFEPATEDSVPDAGSDLEGDVFDLSELVDEGLADEVGDPSDRLTVRLLAMPVQVFADYRSWYDEIRRELRLLAVSHGGDYPVARELSALTLQVEQERRQARGIDRLDAAISRGDDRVDLEYDVPASAGATMTRLLALLEKVDEFCREQRMLTLAPTEQQLALRTWYHGEFARQAAGEDPLPWTGSYAVEPSPR